VSTEEAIRSHFYRSFLEARIFTNDVSTAKMAEITDFGPRKTFFILAIVFGFFTVLWPKILHPMFVGFVTPHHSASDSSGKAPKVPRPKVVDDVRKSLEILRCHFYIIRLFMYTTWVFNAIKLDGQ